ncbi:MAG: GNAT family N-acetyltransferase [Bdellovibrionaceae bacterium]|nr:GNAT family N-acetyltransferase [Pseudobdellovibrionaceae bacterium]
MSSVTSQPIIRKAFEGDERGIHEAHMRSIREICSKAHSPEEIKGWGNRPFSNLWSQLIPSGTLWVIELAEEIHGVGYVKISEESGNFNAHIFGLYLTPEVVGQGLGAKLMKLMINTARDAGAKLVTLDSSINAHDFYKRFGFVDTGPLNFSEIGGSLVRGYPMALKITD